MNKEKQLELYLKRIARLDVEEILGLAKILGIHIAEFIVKEPNDKGEREVNPNIIQTEELITQLIDKFLNQPYKRRKFILKLIKRE